MVAQGILVGTAFLCCLLMGCVSHSSATNCAHDRAALLQLDERAFDQPTSPNDGWRGLAARGGCGLVAADLIRDYRKHHASNSPILYWHEAQLRAVAGQISVATTLMHQSTRPDDQSGWNAYVDATIAFLQHDRAALLAAQSKLEQTPPPSGANVRPVGNGYVEVTYVNGKVSRMRWPLNSDVVEGFVRCFGKSYGEAYSSACRDPK